MMELNQMAMIQMIKHLILKKSKAHWVFGLQSQMSFGLLVDNSMPSLEISEMHQISMHMKIKFMKWFKTTNAA